MQEFRKEHTKFAHRVNENGTLDSICRHCFITIGNSTWEADLERLETAHVCDPGWLMHFDLMERELAHREPVKIVPMRQHA